jgi:hypothetical protein
MGAEIRAFASLYILKPPSLILVGDLLEFGDNQDYQRPVSFPVD